MKNRIVSLLIVCVLLLTSCAGGMNDIQPPQSGESDTTAGSNISGGIDDMGSEDTGDAEIVISSSDMFTDRDKKTEYDSTKSTVIDLSKASSSTVTLTDEGTYVMRGTLDGTVIVDAKSTDKLHLILDGVSIHSETSAALYIKSADKVVITLADGSENSLSSGDSYVAIDDSNIDSALFSRDDLTVNGTGSLTVTAPAGHGIVCKDDLVFTGGRVTINSASHGIDANDSVRVAGTSVTIDSGKDGVHVENTDDASLGFFYMESGVLTAECEGDGIDAAAYANIAGGALTITAGGGYENGESKSSSGFGGFMGGGGFGGGRGGSSGSSSTDDSASTSMKGIKATLVSIGGGTFTIDSADDALHANGSLTVTGGVFEIATGDDALHAEEDLTVSGGVINITNSYEGLEALHITVSGGDIRLVATDDGLNAAGGVDSSGTTGGRDGMFGGGFSGGGRGGPGGGGGMFGGSSDGSITITGGNLYINSSGDGMDANGTLEISGGYTVVVGPTQGDTATLDYDVSATITGGTFIGTGSTMMAQTFSSSENQGVIAVNAGSCKAGTKITLEDAEGNVIIEHAPELNFAVVILSSPDIKKGEEYTLKIGDMSGTFTAQ